MRQQMIELAFRTLTFSDEAFVIALARHAFSAWSQDPGRTVGAMLRRHDVVAEVATQGQERVGFFVLSTRRLRRPFGPIEAPVTAHLDAIAVAPRLVGRGIGSGLLDRAEGRARGKGAMVLSLTTAVGNARAQHLFARHGFLRTMKSASAYANAEDAYEMFKPL